MLKRRSAAFLFMDRFDLISIIGLALVTAGSYLVYEPLALIVPGVLLLLFGVSGARR
jgi:hypothetical protein